MERRKGKVETGAKHKIPFHKFTRKKKLLKMEIIPPPSDNDLIFCGDKEDFCILAIAVTVINIVSTILFVFY